MSLAEKVVIVTGSSRGIGKAMAMGLAEEGAYVVVAARSEESRPMLPGTIHSTVGEIEDAGGKALAVPTNVREEDSIRHMVNRTLDEFGAVDVLINNAAIASYTPFLEMTLKEWDLVMDIDLRAPFIACKSVVPIMIEQGGGSIINISSQLGLVGAGFTSPPYPTSKGAVRLFTKSTAIQHAQDGIRANSVHPGPIDTPMIRDTLTDPARMERRMQRLPLKKIGAVEDIAYGVIYLASDEASFVTGAELVIDGGTTAE